MRQGGIDGEVRIPTTRPAGSTIGAFAAGKSAEFSTGCADASECASPLAWLHWEVSGAIRVSGSFLKDMKMRKSQQGFTLIELMIVVAIIGILASVSIPIYSDYSSRSKAAAAIAEMSGIKTAVGMCMVEAGAIAECKNGAYGIPATFETSNVPSGYSVVAGKIEATTSSTDSGGTPLALVLEPTKDSGSSMVIWKLSGTICNEDRGIKPGAGGCAKAAKEG